VESEGRRQQTGMLLGIARRSKPRDPMERLDEALVTTDAGLDGDCYGGKHGRQVTVVSAEAWKGACRDLGFEVAWTMRRANLKVSGIDLRDSIGARISIGNLVLEITEQNPPCRVMDMQQSGLRKALTPEWRGGVACRVLRAGRIKVGDRASVSAPSAVTR
jgi:MOSC domain-containing protein YiiM